MFSKLLKSPKERLPHWGHQLEAQSSTSVLSEAGMPGLCCPSAALLPRGQGSAPGFWESLPAPGSGAEP